MTYYKPKNYDFSNLLKTIRARVTPRLTQKKLAENLQIAESSIRYWENGDGLPELPNLKKLIEFYVKELAITTINEGERLWALATKATFDTTWFNSLRATANPDILPVQPALEILELSIPSPEDAELHDLVKDYVSEISKQFDNELKKSIELSYKPGIQPNMPDAEFLQEWAELTQPNCSYVAKNYLSKPDESQYVVNVQEELNKHCCLVILGPPGAGKTTTLKQLFKKYSSEWLSDNNQHGLIPLYAQLSNWSQEHSSLLNFLQLWLKDDFSKLAERLPELWQNGKLLLLLDGLNELPGLKRDDKTGLIDDHRSEKISSLTKTGNLGVLSCRVSEFAGGPNWYNLHILPLSEDQIRSIVPAYYNINHPPNKNPIKLAHKLLNTLYTETENEQLEKLKSFITLPFYLFRLLSYYATYEKLSTSPAKLVEFSINKALQREYSSKSFHQATLIEQQLKELKEALGLLAFNMIDAEQLGSVAINQAAAWLFYLREETLPDEEYGEPEATLEDKLKAFELFHSAELANLVIVTGDEIKFYHQLIQEYFCAYYCNKQDFDLELIHRTTHHKFSEVWKMWSEINQSLVSNLIILMETHEPEHPIFDMRGEFASALGAIGDRNAVDTLIKHMSNESSHVRSAIVDALGEIGDPRAIEPIINSIRQEWDRKREAFNVIINYNDALAKLCSVSTEPLIAALNDKDKLVLLHAIQILGSLRDTRAVKPLISILLDPEKDEIIRGSAANALGDIGDQEALLPLLSALFLQDEKCSPAAAEALGKLGNKIAFVPLVIILRNTENLDMFISVIEALGNFGSEAVDILLQFLKIKERRIFYFTISSLGKIGPEATQAIEPLIEAFRDQPEDVRYNIAQALMNIGAEAVNPLVQALESENSSIRAGAAMALEKLGPKAKVAINPLIQLLKDEILEVRKDAIIALGKIGGEISLAELDRIAKEDKVEYIRNLATWTADEIRANNQL